MAGATIFYVLRSGCAWRLLPKDFPPVTTVYGWFLRFRRQHVFAVINHHLEYRIASGLAARPLHGNGDRQPERQDDRVRRRARLRRRHED